MFAQRSAPLRCGVSRDRLAAHNRFRRLLLFDLPPDVDSLDLSAAPYRDLGFAEAGNKGFEGVGWDARAGRLLLARERPPALRPPC